MVLFHFLLKKFKQEKIGKCICNCIHSLALSSFVFVPEVDKLWPILSSQTSLVQQTEELSVEQYLDHGNPSAMWSGSSEERG